MGWDNSKPLMLALQVSELVSLLTLPQPQQQGKFSHSVLAVPSNEAASKGQSHLSCSHALWAGPPANSETKVSYTLLPRQGARPTPQLYSYNPRASIPLAIGGREQKRGRRHLSFIWTTAHQRRVRTMLIPSGPAHPQSSCPGPVLL